MSKKLRNKVFHGKYLVKQLLSAPPFAEKSNLLFDRFENYKRKIKEIFLFFFCQDIEFNKDSAIRYAQNLLESNYLCSDESKSSKSSKLVQNTKSFIKNESAETEKRSSVFNYDRIYLATKRNFYRLNLNQIGRLTDNLLTKNGILNQELEVLFPLDIEPLLGGESNSVVVRLNKSQAESNELFERCVELGLIEAELVVRIMWHRVYTEPLAMKFLSLRQSNYFYFNQGLSKSLRLRQLYFNTSGISN